MTDLKTDISNLLHKNFKRTKKLNKDTLYLFNCQDIVIINMRILG